MAATAVRWESVDKVSIPIETLILQFLGDQTNGRQVALDYHSGQHGFVRLIGLPEDEVGIEVMRAVHPSPWGEF